LGVPDIAQRIANLSPAQRALLEVQLQKKKGVKEPIAIIGIGCRFAGARNPEAFWELLKQGIDAITDVPAGRWDIDSLYDADPAAPGKMYCRQGGFLDQVDQFDPEFFGIAPREAAFIDPQQRLLLEVVWEALEDAAQVPAQLSNSQTGVFVGLSTNDYGQILLRGPEVVDTYTNTGVASTMVANRISYLLNLRGPSIAIDTACSSSLVAVHLACQSLWNGESTLALAGGVNLILTPALTVGFSKLTALSPDGRCKAFDASANGFVRGEGAGMLVLKPLSQAITDGDPVYAIIRGSAVNQDGRSNGLTAPNRAAQEAVLRSAYQNAGVSPAQVQYVEAHGTGTLLGDPIEAKALGQVLSQDRNGHAPARIGSVKSNIGHTEAAAGVASLIKVALSLKHQALVPSLHFSQPNPHIPFDQLPLKIQQTYEPWPESPRPEGNEVAIAGVSSFGFGGTNAHVVLQSAPDLSTEHPQQILTLSAKSASALQSLAERHAQALAQLNPLEAEALANYCFTANTGRSVFAHRLSVVGDTAAAMAEQLRGFTPKQHSSPTSKRLSYGQVTVSEKPQVAFLFTGQGSQYLNMGRDLYESQPVFRQTMDRCNEILLPYLEQSLLSVLYGTESALPDEALLDETVYTQPAIFAVEYSLAKLWQSWGIQPDAVLGHSVGEYVAACIAGVFSLEDGLKLIAERGRLIQTLPANGGMAAIFASAAQVTETLETFLTTEQITIAALNGPDNTVIAGAQETLQESLEKLQLQGIKTQLLQVSHAFHSNLLDPILDLFEHKAQQIQYAAPKLPLFSNVTGALLAPGFIPEATYWRNHARQSVRFAESIVALAEQGFSLFIEVGPHPVLCSMGQACLTHAMSTSSTILPPIWLPSLRRNQADWPQMLSSVGELFVQGVAIDWQGFDRAYSRRRIPLPTYPFERTRYWVDIPTLANGNAHALASVAKKQAPHGSQIEQSADLSDPALPQPLDRITDWQYRVQWRPRTRIDQVVDYAGPDYFLALDQLGSLIGQQIVELSQQRHLDRYEPLGPALDSLSAAYVVQAMQQLLGTLQVGQSLDWADLTSLFQATEAHQRLLRRMLHILVEEAILAPMHDARWQVVQTPTFDTPDVIVSALLSDYPDCRTELVLLSRCGERLADVLKGQCDPLQLLFPDDSDITAEQLYQDSPVAQLFNAGVQDAVAITLAQLPKDRTVRILEIGAGTGGTTAHVLPRLDPDRTDYVFTDISNLFAAKAAQKFRTYPFIQYQSLDIEKDPLTQGYAPQQFDLILAANVLHATQDLRQTLLHVKSLLAPNGLVVLLEGTRPQRWMDLIFGLTEGWWRFSDTDLRSNHPLLSQAQWCQTFQSLGFKAASAAPAQMEHSHVLSQQSVILAQVGAQGTHAPIHHLPKASTQKHHWVILSDAQGVGQQLTHTVSQRGDTYSLVTAGNDYVQFDSQHYQIDLDQSEDFQRLMAQVAQQAGDSRLGIVHLWSLDAPDLATVSAISETSEGSSEGSADAIAAHTQALTRANQLGCQSSLYLLQAIANQQWVHVPKLWLVTQRAQPVVPGEALTIAPSPLWGFGKVASREHGEFWGGLIDLDISEPVAGDPLGLKHSGLHRLATQLLGQMTQTQESETLVAFRAHQRFVARLTPGEMVGEMMGEMMGDTALATLPLTAEATYLLTGGLGGLGLKMAQWMVERGARSLVLVGRRVPTDEAQQVLRTLSDAGATIVVKQVDIAQAAQVSSLLQSIRETLPPLRGILHGAGVLEDGLLVQQDWQQFAKVLKPKVDGAWYLHQLTQTLPLDFFILFSSAAALMGPPAQANHAAANTFLDTLAHYRHAQNLPALSINWGVWADIGAAAERKVDQRMLAQGVGTIPWRQGMEIFAEIWQQNLSAQLTQTGVLPIDWPTFLAQLPDGKVPPFLSEIAARLDEPTLAATNESEVLQALLALPPAQRQDFVVEYLTQQIAKALGTQSEIDCDRNVLELGMDSLMIVDVLNACKRDLKLILYPREFYERPSINPLAEYLAAEINRVHSESPEPTQAKVTQAPNKAVAEIQTWAWSSKQLQRSYSKPTQKLPSAIFVLSSPRSGSTLLRVMLAGHPALFSPPELHLLPFENMTEWQQELGLTYLGEGLQRAYMDLTAQDAQASKTWLDALIREERSTQAVYGELQALAQGRKLVDKSPTYAGQISTLQRAEDLFENAKYIHLVRHPYAVIESLVRNRMDKILGIDNVDPYFLAEQVWSQSNQNVIDFTHQIDPHRHYRIHYEAMVQNPAQEMAHLCEFLEIPYDAALLNPYQGQRMTDGLHAESMPINDPNFLTHQAIDAKLADAWKQVSLPNPLSPSAAQLSEILAYDLPTAPDPDPVPVSLPTPEQHYPMRESMLRVNELQLCLCSWGPDQGPLILGLHGVLEQGAAWHEVAQPLAALGYRVVVPDQRGHGRSDHAPAGNGYQLLDYLADADAIARHLSPEQPFVLVGHSMGSAVAATLTSARPERIKALILVEPVLPAPDAPDTQGQTLRDQLANHLDYLAAPPPPAHLSDLAAAVERLQRMAPKLSPIRAQALAQRLLEPTEQGWRWRWDARLQVRTGLGFSSGAFSRDRYLNLLKQIPVPITLVYGDASTFNKPEDLALQQAAMPQAQRYTIPGEHNLPIDAPQDLANIIATQSNYRQKFSSLTI
jgi:microcystin synthetase protein McyG